MPYSARAFDHRPEETRFTTLLLGDSMERRPDFETDDSRTLAEIMRDKWLAAKEYNHIRHTPEFESVVDALSDKCV